MTFDLEQYRVKPFEQEAPPIEEPAQSNPKEQIQSSGLPFIPKTDKGGFDLEQFRVKPESDIQSGVRQAGQYGLRGIESFLGLPGAFNNLIATGVEKGAELVTGEKNPNISAYAESFRKSGKTPEYFREKGKQLFGETFEPKTEAEASRAEIASDVGAFLNPIGGMMSPAKAIGLALAGKAGKEATKLFTTSEGKQEAGKVGTMFVMDLLMRRISGDSAKKFIDNLYSTERSLIPQGAKADGTSLQQGVNKIIQDIDKSKVTTASSQLVRKSAKNLLKDIKNGEADVEGLLLAKKRLNEIRGDPAYLKHEEPVLNALSNEVEKAIEGYGNSSAANPNFLRYHKDANEAFGTMAQSQKLSKFIGKSLPKQLSHFGLTLFGELVAGYPGAILPTIGAAAAVKTGELLYRVMASPNLRRHYLRVLKEAGAQNVKATSRAVSQLDKAMQREFRDEDIELPFKTSSS